MYLSPGLALQLAAFRTHKTLLLVESLDAPCLRLCEHVSSGIGHPNNVNYGSSARGREVFVLTEPMPSKRLEDEKLATK